MSTDTTPTTEVTLDTTEVNKEPATEVESSVESCIELDPQQEVTAVRKEYSIVGDLFYAGLNAESAPTWLTDLIDSVVANAVANGLTDYDLLVQDVRNAIAALDVAANTYVEQINFTTLVDGIIGTHLATLNAEHDGKFATIVDLDVVEANADSALTLRASQLESSFNTDITTQITTVQTAYTSADEALGNDITALTTAFTDQETNLSGLADAVTGLQTYVGLDGDTNNPNGLGLLARTGNLENQNDGAVEITSNTYDVMSGIEDPNTNTANDATILDAMPYVQWSNMTGTGDPSGTTRPYMDYSLETPASANIPVLEGTLYTRTDFTDAAVDKYWKFSGNSWAQISTPVAPVGGETAQELLDLAASNEQAAQDAFDAQKNINRTLHIGDVYIMYDDGTGDTRTYIRSYKFIKSTVQTPLTDADGFGWAIVTDTDAQSIYMAALQARDMADGKMSHFYAWSDNDDPTPANRYPTSFDIVTQLAEYKIDQYGNYLDAGDNITTNPAEYVELVPAVTETIDATNVAYWFNGNVLYRKGPIGWSDKEPVPTASGDGIFIAVGDMLTVFDPIDRDTSTYWFDGSNWQTNGPAGLISQSRWFVDLENSITSPHGSVAASINQLKLESELYTDGASVKATSSFTYDSTMYLGGFHYQAGFGLSTFGISQTGLDGTTPATAFDSEFWINAERFVLKSPTYPSVSAAFEVTATGIKLGLEHTEATRNTIAGIHDSANTYQEGDIVTFGGSSYMAIQDVPTSIAITNTAYWQVLAEGGITGASTDYQFTRKSSTPADPGGADTWYTNVLDVPAGSGDLWSITVTTPAGGGDPVYSDKRVIEAPLVRELVIYSNKTTGTFTSPVASTYNFTNNTLNINDANWNNSIPGSLEDGEKIYITTALVTGNSTQASVSVSWNAATVFATRVDGAAGSFVDYLFTRKSSTPADPGGADIWYTSVTSVPAGSGDLWSITATTPVGGGDVVYSDKRVIDAPIIRELTIYSDATTGSHTKPTNGTSTYNFVTNTLNINDVNWNSSVPDLTADAQKIYVTTALVQGNATQNSVGITWNTASIYAQRSDGSPADPVIYTYSPTENGTFTTGFEVGDEWAKISVDNGSTYGPAFRIVGENAPDVLFQYAPAEGGPFTAGFAAGVDFWARNSTDGGATWGTPYKLVGSDGDPADPMVIEYSANQGGPWDTTFNAGIDLWARTSVDGGSTFTAAYRIVGQDGQDGQDGTTALGPGFNAVAAWSNSDANSINYDVNEDAIALQSSSDTSYGMAYPAFDVSDGKPHVFTITYKTSTSAASGFYIRVGEYDSALPSGKNYVAPDGVSAVQTSTRQQNFGLENLATTTSYQTVTVTYTPTGSANWASLNLLNGTGLGSRTLYIKAIERIKEGTGTRGITTGAYTLASGITTVPASVASSTVAGWWNSAVPAEFQAEIEGDTLVVANPHSTLGWTHIFTYNGSTWSAGGVFTVNGNQIVDGTITADALVTGLIIAEDATFTGTLDIDSSGIGSGERMEINDNQILVYDNTNTLRVKIGNLA